MADGPPRGLERGLNTRMAVRKILLLGDPHLFEKSQDVCRNELPLLKEMIVDMHDTLMDFRKKHGCGRAIAAPQIGMAKRIVYMHIDHPLVFINPILDRRSPQMLELWDDCMSFPELLVRVKRHRSCRISFRDEDWRQKMMLLDGALSELLQHEVDHLDGVLATQRAVDDRSLALKSQKKLLDFPPDQEPA